MVPRSSAAVDDAYREGVAKGVHVIEEPHDDVFGRTFVIANPDGNLIRVSPCLLYTSPSPRDLSTSRMPSSA